MKLPTSLQQALQQLTANTLVLTRTKRQATYLMQQWVELQSQTTIIHHPTILPIQTWIENTFKEISSAQIINHSDLYMVLQPIVKKHNTDQHLDLDSTIKSMIDAWHLLHNWLLTPNTLKQFSSNHSIDLFKQCTHDLAIYLNDKAAVTHSQLIAALIEHDLPNLKNDMLLYGFIQTTPAEQALIETLKQQINLSHMEADLVADEPKVVAVENNQQEYQVMAEWALQQHQQHPDKTFMCVVPDLQQCRTDIEEAFLQADDESLELLNISGGEPLSTTPLWSTALSLLNVNKHRCHYKDLAKALKTQHWGMNDIAGIMAKDQLISHIKNQGRTYISLIPTLQQLIDNAFHKKQTPYLKNWLEHTENRPSGKQTYQTWMFYFYELLIAIGWPGQFTLTSAQHQEHHALEQLWLIFYDFDKLLPPCTFDHAIKTMNQLSKQTLFAPETHNRPIQVLGTLEAQHIYSDGLWMIHLNENQWPPHKNLNPYLPVSLQKQYKMPYADASKQHEYFETLSKQLWHQSPQTTLSYAKFHNNQAQQSCFFLNNFSVNDLNIAMPFKPALKDTAAFKGILDNQAPALHSHTIPGGSYGYQSQAQCPFQFMAHYRLKTSDQDLPYLGYDAADRGSLVHETLAFFWDNIKDSQQLHQLSEDQLDKQIQQAIQHALSQSAQNIFKDAEMERLFTLVKQWIALEKQRPAFSVKQTEQTITFQNQQMTTKMRIDRVDQLADNNTLIIDYKTSKQASTLGWFDDRLTSPQIPLYLLSMQQANAASLALVKRGDPKFLGMSEQDLDIKGIKNVADYTEDWNWLALKKQWLSQISLLTEEIKQGFAAVSPDTTSSPCDYCDLQLFCRVHHD